MSIRKRTLHYRISAPTRDIFFTPYGVILRFWPMQSPIFNTPSPLFDSEEQVSTAFLVSYFRKPIIL